MFSSFFNLINLYHIFSDRYKVVGQARLLPLALATQDTRIHTEDRLTEALAMARTLATDKTLVMDKALAMGKMLAMDKALVTGKMLVTAKVLAMDKVVATDKVVTGKLVTGRMQGTGRALGTGKILMALRVQHTDQLGLDTELLGQLTDRPGQDTDRQRPDTDRLGLDLQVDGTALEKEDLIGMRGEFRPTIIFVIIKSTKVEKKYKSFPK